MSACWVRRHPLENLLWKGEQVVSSDNSCCTVLTLHGFWGEFPHSLGYYDARPILCSVFQFLWQILYVLHARCFKIVSCVRSSVQCFSILWTQLCHMSFTHVVMKFSLAFLHRVDHETSQHVGRNEFLFLLRIMCCPSLLQCTASESTPMSFEGD